MRTRRILVGGGAVLALVAAVALASRAHTPAGTGGTRHLDTDVLSEYALLLVAAAAAVILPFGIYLFASGRDELAETLPKRGNWMISLFVMMSVISLIAAVVLGSRLFGNHHRSAPNVPNPLAPAADAAARARQAVAFDWTPVVVVGALTVLAVVAVAYVLFGPRRRTSREATPAAVLAQALERTIADLRAEDDPRRAVIAAYAQMEGALARARLPREPSEAPREYLGRVLPEVGAGADSVARLTALFEQAKFSPHTIDEPMKADAIDALETLRDELRSKS